MKRTVLFLLALASALVMLPDVSQAQARRVERNSRQLDRQTSRMINRGDYYTTDVWTQVNPWVTQYNIPPVRPLARAAEGAANAANRAANATERALFGYTNPNAAQSADVWFYDYYTYRPSYYMSSNDAATNYSSAIRYYDYDNDGVYESTYSYRDSDKDGKFDEFDRHDYTSVEVENETDETPQDAKRYSISGKIESQKAIKVNETESLIVRVKQEDGNLIVVDLGPSDRWGDDKIQDGASIKAIGPMERIGEKDVLMAESVVIAEKQIRVERSMPSYTGTVREVKQFKVNNADHTLVVVETPDGNLLVDLGPEGSLKVNLAPKEKIVVYGVPVHAHDHQVVMASRFDFGGQTHSIIRWK